MFGNFGKIPKRGTSISKYYKNIDKCCPSIIQVLYEYYKNIDDPTQDPCTA